MIAFGGGQTPLNPVLGRGIAWCGGECWEHSNVACDDTISAKEDVHMQIRTQNIGGMQHNQKSSDLKKMHQQVKSLEADIV